MHESPQEVAASAPPKAWLFTLLLHGLGVLMVQAVGQATVFILPVLAKRYFGASDWQSLLITMPPTVLFVLSIFWGGIFARSGFTRAVALYFVVACLPIAAIAPARDFWWLLVPHIIASAGGAAWPILSGSLLKSIYAKDRQSRAYSSVWGASMLCSAGLGWLVGDLLTTNPESFRAYMPAAVCVQLLGVWLLWHVGRRYSPTPTGPNMGASMHAIRDGTRQRTALGSAWGDALHEVWSPIAHMREVLKQDRVFARYEGAYMTYGAGWMIGYALLPILATKKLDLSYEQFARSTHVAYLLALVACLYPAALALDKLGAVRSTAISFFLLLFYPIGLMFARNETDLIIVSACYGVAHAGASVGWMLGPVSLAPSPDKVPAYVAIHATLVGLRGAVFQFLGVALYRMTDSFTWPLVIASLAYAWSAWQMFALARVMPKRASKA
jgi:hypothetical protein